MKRIGILTSGGDAPGMNAAVRAAVRTGLSMDMEVYGIERGYEGLLDGDIKKMEWHSVGDILQRGGTILRTARSERFMTEEGQEHAMNMLETFGIEGLVVIGGDGSFRGGLELDRRGLTVMGVPGTIDNDLAYTDYTCLLYTSGLDFISLIAPTSHDRITTIAKEASGFVYCVSSLGVTGVRSSITTDIGAMVDLVKKAQDIPCAVGFGISTPQQAADMAEKSDGVIVGSAIVKLCEKHGAGCVPYRKEYVAAMKTAIS